MQESDFFLILTAGMMVPNLWVYWGAGRPLILSMLVIMLLVWVCNWSVLQEFTG